MKIIKILGALVLLAGVFAIGYWRGQSDPKADHALSGHSATETSTDSQSMQGHDTSSGGCGAWRSFVPLSVSRCAEVTRVETPSTQPPPLVAQ